MSSTSSQSIYMQCPLDHNHLIRSERLSEHLNECFLYQQKSQSISSETDTILSDEKEEDKEHDLNSNKQPLKIGSKSAMDDNVYSIIVVNNENNFDDDGKLDNGRNSPNEVFKMMESNDKIIIDWPILQNTATFLPISHFVLEKLSQEEIKRYKRYYCKYIQSKYFDQLF